MRSAQRGPERPWKQMRHSLRAQVPIFYALLVFAGTVVMARAQRSGETEGEQQFASTCAACHGSDGSGAKAPSIIGPNIASLSDAELLRVVHNGTAAGMPSFAQLGDAKIAAVVRYLRTLQGQGDAGLTAVVTGDAEAGRVLYFGRAQCSSCHMIAGQGGFIASDLTAYGRSHPPQAIVQAIVDPDKNLAAQSRAVEVRTKKGQTLTGVLRSEDNFNLVLQTEDGRFHFFARSSLADVQYANHSLMPRDYGTRLTSAELNDLAAFLIATSRTAPTEPEPARRRRGGDL